MTELLFVTGNANKFNTASIVLQRYGIQPIQARYDIVEIQDENTEVIARDKASKAFALAGKPVVITDDDWSIPGLRGFPGPYMKSLNHWFTPGDWLNVTRSLTDRRILLHQQLVYQDESTQQLFVVTLEGTLLTEPKGAVADEPSATIISFDPTGRSIAEVRDSTGSAISNKRTAWHELAEWLQKRGT